MLFKRKTMDSMMTGAGILILLRLTVSGSTEITCSDMDVLNHLNLTASNDLLSMIRPVKNSKTPTSVNLDMALYAILDVREIDQTFIPYVWMYMSWKNEFTSWNSSDFCDIEKVAIPTNILWKPDITIEEMTGKDQTPPSPYVTIFSDGWVQQVDNQVLTSTCKMDIYKFPFDVQQCNLTFKSIVHSNKELRLYHVLDSNETTEWALEMMHTQYEWLFMDMEVTNTTEDNINFGIQDVIIFSIKMRRRSVLYSTNLLLPVLFFLCLDLSSFLISDRGGEKLGFKITVLLAVTVMQLILNEILPSSSNSVPLIAVYCIGMFTLMLLSLLETILVMYLIQKDSVALDSEKQHDWSLSEDGKRLSSYEQGRKVTYFCTCSSSTDECPAELLKASDSQQHASQSAERLSGDINQLIQALTQLINSKTEADKVGYWSRMTVTINRVFCVFYVTAVSVFLVFMFIQWQ